MTNPVLFPLGGQLYWDSITTNVVTGNVTNADSTPSYAIYRNAVSTAELSGNLTQRGNLTGDYFGNVAITGGTIAVGDVLAVITTAIVGNVTGKIVSVQLRIGPAEIQTGVPLVDIKAYKGGNVSASQSGIPDINVLNIGNTTRIGAPGYLGVDWGNITATGSVVALGNTTIGNVTGGLVGVNVTRWNGGNVTAATAGIPDVNVKNIGNATSAGAAGYAAPDWSHVNAPGTAVVLGNTTISATQVVASVTGAVTVGTNNDKTGYGLSASQAFNNTGTWTGSVGSVLGSVGGDVLGTVGNVTGTPSVNLVAINGNSTSAQRLARSAGAIGIGTVGNGSSATSIVTSAFSPAPGAANQFGNRTVLFDPDTTTAGLRDAVGVISASTNSATPVLTVTALPATPANGDTFLVI